MTATGHGPSFDLEIAVKLPIRFRAMMRNTRIRVYVLKKFPATSPGNLAHLMDRLGPSDLFGNSKSSVTVRSFYRVFSFMMDHGNFGSM